LRQVQHVRHAPEALRDERLGGRAGKRDAPYRAEQREADAAAHLHGGEWRVGCGDFDEDGGVIAAPQQPAARAAREVVGGGEAEHSEHAERVDDDGGGGGGGGGEVRERQATRAMAAMVPAVTPTVCTQASAISSALV
jgi:hypothetical protein